MATFGDWLQERIDAEGLDVLRLAQRMRCSRSVVYQWLRNEVRPRAQNLSLLAKILHVEPMEMYRMLGGFKPLDPERNRLIGEINLWLEDLSEADREVVLVIVQSLYTAHSKDREANEDQMSAGNSG